MDNVQILQLIIDGLGILVMFFMSQWVSDLKSKNSSLQNQVNNADKEITNIRLHYVHKDDFSEFKKELWDRFDKLENLVRK